MHVAMHVPNAPTSKKNRKNTPKRAMHVPSRKNASQRASACSLHSAMQKIAATAKKQGCWESIPRPHLLAFVVLTSWDHIYLCLGGTREPI
jgi:hypothetical protein